MNATINGVDIYYEIHGDGDPILFVHGFPLSGGLWAPLVEPLSATHKLIIPDLRGFGRSAVADTARMSDFADDLRGLLREIGENRPVVLVGLSMGGYIAFEFFRRHADVLRALVLADTRAEPDAPEARKGRLESADKVMSEGSAVVADPMREKLFAPHASAALKDEWHAIMASTDPRAVAATLRGMADRPDSRRTLHAIHVPTLVVVGEHDAITPPELAQTIHTEIAGSMLAIISGAGHMPPVEKPAAFANAVKRFLATLPAMA